MKLRIKGNSIRLRLTKTEVETIGKEGYIEERTAIGHKVFTYALQQYDGANLSAGMDDDKITVYIPMAFTKGWADDNRVGFEYEQEWATGKKLYLLIEKDFKCLDEDVKEDQGDQYDHPLIPQ